MASGRGRGAQQDHYRAIKGEKLDCFRNAALAPWTPAEPYTTNVELTLVKIKEKLISWAINSAGEKREEEDTS